MFNRRFMLPVAVLTAGCAAVGLYTLAHDVIGISRHSIVMDSFGSATFFAIACVIATVTRRGTK
jgi:hypothetical protein